jgi:hypothetical protein
MLATIVTMEKAGRETIDVTNNSINAEKIPLLTDNASAGKNAQGLAVTVVETKTAENNARVTSKFRRLIVGIIGTLLVFAGLLGAFGFSVLAYFSISPKIEPPIVFSVTNDYDTRVFLRWQVGDQVLNGTWLDPGKSDIYLSNSSRPVHVILERIEPPTFGVINDYDTRVFLKWQIGNQTLNGTWLNPGKSDIYLSNSSRPVHVILERIEPPTFGVINDYDTRVFLKWQIGNQVLNGTWLDPGKSDIYLSNSSRPVHVILGRIEPPIVLVVINDYDTRVFLRWQVGGQVLKGTWLDPGKFDSYLSDPSRPVNMITSQVYIKEWNELMGRCCVYHINGTNNAIYTVSQVFGPQPDTVTIVNDFSSDVIIFRGKVNVKEGLVYFYYMEPEPLKAGTRLTPGQSKQLPMNWFNSTTWNFLVTTVCNQKTGMWSTTCWYRMSNSCTTKYWVNSMRGGCEHFISGEWPHTNCK